ncbi:unnamed protein product [Rotaria sordida]|uniref:Superoxide dismutase [Cu-Zn] n=1 Tax=Rotaria sordida TaxID=392033 RepID=A0A814WH94_9BILA|nr:unnamed protein product [Rotaria sordida]CAF1201252.1 unnamed protein product [Rotaria sordida]
MNATADVKYDLNTTSIGVLIFTQDNADSPVKITGTLTGLYSNASLGFHIHQSSLTGNIPNCTAAGAHFNPYNVGHGARNGTICTRHVGDLGNIQTDENGTITIDISDSIIQLYNNTARSIINLPVVVHTQMDDLGTGTSPNSTTTGNAGGRIACGNIELRMNPSDGSILHPTFLMVSITCLFPLLFSML